MASTFEKKPNEVWVVGDPYTHGLQELDVFWSKDAVVEFIKKRMSGDVLIAPNGRSMYAREKFNGYRYNRGQSFDAHLFAVKQDDWEVREHVRALRGEGQQ